MMRRFMDTAARHLAMRCLNMKDRSVRIFRAAAGVP